MPATSAGWLAMLLSGGTLSGAGMMLRRRKQ
jgi:LPXTG-motif cell wall-anchored protein